MRGNVGGSVENPAFLIYTRFPYISISQAKLSYGLRPQTTSEITDLGLSPPPFSNMPLFSREKEGAQKRGVCEILALAQSNLLASAYCSRCLV